MTAALPLAFTAGMAAPWTAALVLSGVMFFLVWPVVVYFRDAKGAFSRSPMIPQSNSPD